MSSSLTFVSPYVGNLTDPSLPIVSLNFISVVWPPLGDVGGQGRRNVMFATLITICIKTLYGYTFFLVYLSDIYGVCWSLTQWRKVV